MIKQPWLASIAGIFFIVFAWYVYNRVIFLQTAEKTTGTVIKVSAYNGRCGGGRRRRSYPCTKFHADIMFHDLKGASYRFNVSSGSSRGDNQPISYSRLKLNSAVPVIYDPKNPTTVYEDTLWGVWATPIFLFFAQVASFFGSLFDRKRR